MTLTQQIKHLKKEFINALFHAAILLENLQALKQKQKRKQKKL